jgi:hypothetical protein
MLLLHLPFQADAFGLILSLWERKACHHDAGKNP